MAKTKKKIKELFKYRKIPELMDQLALKKTKKLYKKLISLQMAIYELDELLESNWKVKKKDLTKEWKKIYAALEDLGYAKKECHDLTSHIRRYQKHELQLREGKLPTRLNTEYYYHYKSCDVRLMREIIYDSAGKNKRSREELEEWRYFDLITEVNDDIADVFEDQKTINGNMFLISAYLEGTERTRTRFRDFIYSCMNKAQKHFEKSENRSSLSKNVRKWTNRCAEETLELLDRNAQKIDNQGVSSKFFLKK